jgi:glycosyltransferase involved in cell wall biosynthesis
MYITIHLLCFNEKALLPHTIHHYKTRFPEARIVIHDNGSTDGCIDIAKHLGCEIVPFETQFMDEFKQAHIKNNAWKTDEADWVIMADMDEWLDITELELKKEDEAGTTLIRAEGYNIVGDSKTVDLVDLNSTELKFGIRNSLEDKTILFKRSEITEISYGCGAHTANPQGRLQWSTKIFWLKHIDSPGLEFFVAKNLARYARSHEMRKFAMDVHYIADIDSIQKEYEQRKLIAKPLPS